MIRVSPASIGDQGNGYIAHVCVATIQAIHTLERDPRY